MTRSNLAEAMIKLPHGLLGELKAYMLTCYFAHVMAEVEKRYRFEEDDLELALRLTNAAANEFSVKPTVDQVKIAHHKTAYIKTFGTDEQVYGESLPKVRLKVQLDRQANLNSNLGVYQDATAFITLSPFNMHMTGASLRTIASLRYSLAKVPELIATLEHELTHLVQHRVLRKKHEVQVAAHDDYSISGIVDSPWALSDVEFDPAIKSARGELEKLTRKYKGSPGYNFGAMRDAFLFVGPLPKFMHPRDTNQFFELLKQHDIAKWKKAVKLFMTAH